MLLGFGWCHLRSSREAIREARLSDIDQIEAEIDAADQKLWNEFRTWMEVSAESFIQWQLCESLNNEKGLLTWCVSRNHRSSAV
ncbi:hypothetical protein [Gimesia sp.]|uniref:hypothetical protein n=1 Tax=Gimesia sp. TaxID=2024833 RepID=UPI0032EE0512